MREFIIKNRLAIQLTGTLLSLLLLLIGWLTGIETFYILAVTFTVVAGAVVAGAGGVAVVAGAGVALAGAASAAFAGVVVVGVVFIIANLLIILNNPEDKQTISNWFYAFLKGVHNRQLKTQQGIKAFWQALTFKGEKFDGEWGDLKELNQELKNEGIPFLLRFAEINHNRLSLIINFVKDLAMLPYRSQSHRNE